jgi:LCP family protein required for cell wall assembly
MHRAAAAGRATPAGKLVKRGLLALLVVANLAVFAFLFYVNGLRDAVVGSIETIPVEELPALVPVDSAGDGPMFVLLVGSDERAEGIEDQLGDVFGHFEGQRADVIMLFRIDAGQASAQLVSLPRDLLVRDDGGAPTKLNSAYGGNPNGLIEVVSQVTGVAINHYVEVDFVGFANIVDELGGIDFYFPHPSRDEKSGLFVEQGTVHLDGPTALAYARSRNFEELVAGNWRRMPGSDLERTRRQQELIFAILNEAKRPSNLLGMGELVSAVGEQIKTDSALDYETLRDVAWAMRGFDATELEAVTLPVAFTAVNGISYVVEREPQAADVLAAFKQGASLTEAGPRSLRVEVRNGNGRKGAAADFAEALEQLGHVAAFVGNAPNNDYQSTLIVTRAGEEELGDLLAGQLGFGSVTDGNLSTGGIDLIVYLGADAVGFGES